MIPIDRTPSHPPGPRPENPHAAPGIEEPAGGTHELEAKLTADAAQLEAAKQRGREIELEKKKLEVDAQTKRDSIGKFRTQQFQTRKNEEFQALTNEIKRFERRHREDRGSRTAS